MKTMNKNKIISYLGILIVSLIITACKLPYVGRNVENANVPNKFSNSQDSSSTDTTNTAAIKWRDYFKDTMLTALIDSALHNNQELNIILQEIQIHKNEVRAKKGEYLPTVGVGLSAGVEKTARYTRDGASEAANDIMPGKPTPDILPNYMIGFNASWEIDIWGKLHKAKRAAFNRFLASVEGKNFMVTNLVSEIARLYYELLALDNQLIIVKQNIQIQSNALEIVNLQKQSAIVTELAVRRFEAEVYHTKSLQFEVQQQIVETENKINFLVGRFPQHINRSSVVFTNITPDTTFVGVPSQLLENRRDIKEAELKLVAAKLDVKVAKAQFYPSLSLDAGVGFRAFNPTVLFKSPLSILWGLVGHLIAPLINRNAIKATYYSSNSKQIQAVYNYEQAILRAYIEVSNQMANIENLRQNYALKSKQVKALNESITISINLFKSAQADYMEVLFTQRDALESKFDLIETQKQRLIATINMYKALGGGWN